MRWPVIWTLFQKEALEILRDRRTLIVMLLLPMLIYPLFGLLASQAQFSQRRKIKKSSYTIGIVGPALPRTLTSALQHTDKLRYLTPKQSWKQALRRGKFALVLQHIPPQRRFTSSSTQPSTKSSLTKPSARATTKSSEATPTPTSHTPVSLRQKRAKTRSAATKPAAKPKAAHPTQRQFRLYYASTRDVSRAVRRRVEKAMRTYNREVVKQRLHQRGLPLIYIKPLAVKKLDVVSRSGRGRYALSRFIPLLIIMMTVMGAFYPAIECTAGEKERKTLETLLTAPITSLEIVASKYMLVTCIASITGGLNLLSLGLTFAQGTRLAGIGKSLNLGISPTDYAAILFFLLLVAALASAVMIVVAAIARSFKEAQNYVTPAYLVCLLPAMLTILPGSKPSLSSAFIPMVNVSYAIQGALNRDLSGFYILITIVSMALFIGLALVAAGRLFQHEQALFREGEFTFTSLLASPQQNPRALPSLNEMLFLVAIQFLLLVYVGTTVQAKSPTSGLAITLWGLFFGVTLLFARLRKVSLVETFRLKRFTPKIIPSLLLLAVGGLVVVSTISHNIGKLLPGWQNFLEQAAKAFDPSHYQLSLPMFLLLFAFSPGICEELMFRGFVQSSLRKAVSARWAIVIAALLFGAFHLSVYRLLPTTVLGITFGWLCYRTGSIFPAMIAHALNNGLALVSTKIPWPAFQDATSGKSSPALLIVATLCFVVGLVSIHKFTAPPTPHET